MIFIVWTLVGIFLMLYYERENIQKGYVSLVGLQLVILWPLLLMMRVLDLFKKREEK